MYLVRSVLSLTIVIGCVLSGCAVDTGLDDGTWQATGKIAQANLTVLPDGTGHVDFVFDYLLGLVDDEGIGEVTWSYALTDRSRRPYGSVTEAMRQLKPNESSPLFVEGTRTRRLTIEQAALDTVQTYVLWVKVFYRDSTLYELLVPVGATAPYVDEDPIDDIREFSIGR